MNQSQYPSTLLQKAVTEISRLPGIGSKTALRLALHLLKQDVVEVDALADSIKELRHHIGYCKVCHNISDTDGKKRPDKFPTVIEGEVRDGQLFITIHNLVTGDVQETITFSPRKGKKVKKR